MLDCDELNKIMTYMTLCGDVYDKSVYKYGIYKKMLQDIYPAYNDYRIKKIFDYLIFLGYIHKVPTNKSFKYQFIEFTKTPKVEQTKQGRFILYFD